MLRDKSFKIPNPIHCLWSIYTLFITDFFLFRIFPHFSSSSHADLHRLLKQAKLTPMTATFSFVLQVSNGSSYPQMLSNFRAALFTVYSLCVSIFYILHMIYS